MAALPQDGDWDEGNEDDIAKVPNCYCPNCGGGHATTVMLPTKIPLFREIIIMTLNCEECNFCNSEVNFAGEIQSRGDKITLKVTCRDDLDRQLIKSDSASLLIPKLDFEIPPKTQRGTVSTIEGVLRRAVRNIQTGQPDRLKLGDVDNFYRCKNVIEQINFILGDVSTDDDDSGNDKEEEQAKGQIANNSFEPFDIVLDDPAGNSFIENPHAPANDPCLQHEKYYRTPNQDMALGLQPSRAAVKDGSIDDTNPAHKNVCNAPEGKHPLHIDSKEKSTTALSGGKDKEPPSSLGRQEVIKFPTDCPHCHAKTETNMCAVDIPHFKEVIIMSMLCENCGYKSSEIKGGGAIPKLGTKVSVKLETSDDLAREVLKSDTAGIEIPELGLELNEGGLDGLYTTIEGLLNKMHERLVHAHPFQSGDAARKHHLSNDGDKFSGLIPDHARYFDFLDRLRDMAAGKILPFTLIVNDPLSNSFVGPVPMEAAALAAQAEKEESLKCYDMFIDPNILIEEYKRTEEQDEQLGLNDIKTENYQEIEQKEGKYYGTDQMEDLSDRLRRIDRHGPDHPL